MQEQKLSISIIELIEEFGLDLIHKILAKHTEKAEDILPHLENMPAHELSTVMSIANGLMATKASSDNGGGLPPDPTHPKP